jgi:hypothetical protein
MSPEQTEALQAVVDRVGAYQESAEERVVVDELREGVGEAGLDVADDDVRRLADAIERDGGPVQVHAVLG